jgi:hypothetical protein
MNELSFREKSVGISLVATIVIFGYYFANVIEGFASDDLDQADLFWLFVSVVVMMIVVEVVLHIVLVIGAGQEYVDITDERDRIIELKATRNAYFLLTAGVIASFFGLLLATEPLLMANILLGFLVGDELLKFASQLYYYRRSI